MIFSNIVDIIFSFMIFFVIFIIVLEIFCSWVLKGKKNIGEVQLRLFGIFLELDDWAILAISSIFVRYLFLLWSLFSKNVVNSFYLIFFLILSLIFSFSTRSIKNFILEGFSSFALYFALICHQLLYYYTIEVRPLWYVSLGNILLILFLVIYGSFFLLRGVHDVASKAKYVRRKRNEDS